MSCYNVEFIGDYYNLITQVSADSPEEAEANALVSILREYRWDLEATYSQVEITEDEECEN